MLRSRDIKGVFVLFHSAAENEREKNITFFPGKLNEIFDSYIYLTVIQQLPSSD